MQPRQVNKKRLATILSIIMAILLAISFYFIIRRVTQPQEYNPFNYQEFIEDLKKDRFVKQSDGKVVINIKKSEDNKFIYVYAQYNKDSSKFDEKNNHKQGKLIKLVLTDGLYTNFITELNQEPNLNIVQNYEKPKTSVLSVILNFLPYVLWVIIIIIFFRGLMKTQEQAQDFSKSRVKLAKTKQVLFDDVAGCDEEKQELSEVIDFLKNPKKYRDIGARIPKGILLVGSPGTGKTLLAKAVAGESNVPFFSISGSDFVELYVGVGASRVRNMFSLAKDHAPCIIFIDEIDAVGRQRGTGLGGGNDEKEQTLNQLLVEMDGYNPNAGIIIIAATNRPDVLDPALLRPGRFDRQITMDLPDAKARTAILKVHARNKHFESSVNFDAIAYQIPGFSGADIENLLNESALLAARDNRKVICEKDIEEGIDRVMMGPAKVSRKYSNKEKVRVAFHEAGHAVIGLKLEDANVVQKITIIPRGKAGGYNLMVPKEENYFETKESLLATITGYLGGRAAEELALNSISNGAHNDFEIATKLARAMVTEYGMSKLGTVQYESQQGDVFLGRDYLKERNFSNQVALEIDQEVREIIDSCLANAKKILKENRALLNSIAKYLIFAETINKAEIDEINQTGKLEKYDQKIIEVEAKVKENSSDETALDLYQKIIEKVK